MRRRGPRWQQYEQALEQVDATREQLSSANAELEQHRIRQKQAAVQAQAEQNNGDIPIVDARYVNGLGKYMVPQDDTLTNHYRLVFQRDNELDFWPEQSPAFDGLVAQTYLAPAFSKPNHPSYLDYEPLRDNISTIRNYALQTVLKGVDLGDKNQVANAQRKLEQMGREVGVALQRDSLFRRPGSAHLNVHAASEPGVGAAKIYELLEKKQQRSHFLAPVKRLFGYNYTDWGLPPIENSPFSKSHVEAFCLGDFNKPAPAITQQHNADDAPAPQLEQAVEPEIQQEADTHTPAVSPAIARQLLAYGSAAAGAATSLERVQAMPKPAKTRSVELAREILDKLRVNFSATNRDQWLERPADEAVVENEALSSILELYSDSYHAAITANPQLKDDPQLQQSNLAMGKLSYMLQEQAGMKLLDAGMGSEAAALIGDLQNLPQSWQQDSGETVATLLSQLQTGLEMTYSAALDAQQKGLIASPDEATLPTQQLENTQLAAKLGSDAAIAQAAQQQNATLNEHVPATPEMLKNMLEQSNLSPQELATMRNIQMQSSTVTFGVPNGKVKQRSTPPPQQPAQDAPAGSYRAAVLNQGREQQSIKR